MPDKMPDKLMIPLTQAMAEYGKSPSQLDFHESLVWFFKDSEEVYFEIDPGFYNMEVAIKWCLVEDGKPGEFVSWEFEYMWGNQVSDPTILSSESDDEQLLTDIIYSTSFGIIKTDYPSGLHCKLRRAGNKDNLPSGAVGLSVELMRRDTGGPSLKLDDDGTFRMPTRDETKDIVIGPAGTDHFEIKPAGEVIETVLIGEVRDPHLDCCHLGVIDHDGCELLHSKLIDFENEKVRITIERCD